MCSGAPVCFFFESPFHKCSCVFLLGWLQDWHLSPDPSMFSRRPACPLCQPVILPKPSLSHSTTSPHLSHTHTHTWKVTSPLNSIIKFMKGKERKQWEAQRHITHFRPLPCSSTQSLSRGKPLNSLRASRETLGYKLKATCETNIRQPCKRIPTSSRCSLFAICGRKGPVCCQLWAVRGSALQSIYSS